MRYRSAIELKNAFVARAIDMTLFGFVLSRHFWKVMLASMFATNATASPTANTPGSAPLLTCMSYASTISCAILNANAHSAIVSHLDLFLKRCFVALHIA